MFNDELTLHLSNILPVTTKNIILGDFNMHVDVPTDNKAMIFNAIMQAMGLNQHVNKETHRGGNKLDLILTDKSNETIPGTCEYGEYVLDH